ncbi:MAG: AAA family ATPase [Clostridium sp.]|nr:AAA family ATPase [Clostridium sp.]
MKKNNRDFDKILNKIKEVEERDGICIYGDVDHPLTKEDLKNMSEKEILELLLFIIDTDEYEPSPQDSRKEKIEKVMKMIDDMSMVLNVNFYDGSLGQALSKEDIICLTNEELDDLLEDQIILFQQTMDDLENGIELYNMCDKYLLETEDDVKDLQETFQVSYVNNDDNKGVDGMKNKEIPTPKEMVKELDKRIYANENLKKKLTTAIYRKLITMEMNKGQSKDILDTPNILICGGTGTSKTYSVKCIADMLNIPVYTINASQLTPSSYKGTGINDELYYIVSEGGYNESEPSIIFLDEIDKLACFSNDSKEVGKLVMGELLKLVEGKGEINLSASMGGRQVPFTLNLDNVIFIFAGAFDGIVDIVKKRLGEDKKKSVGFGVGITNDKKVEGKKDYYQLITKDDLNKYGLTPEFLGRTTFAVTDSMTEDMLMNIIEKENSALDKSVQLFKYFDKKLSFSKECKKAICKKAIASGYGARSLNDIFFSITDKILFDISEYTEEDIVIDESFLD